MFNKTNTIMSLFDSASLVVTPNGVKEDKLYSVKPTDGSGDLNVIRATTATRVNSDGLIESVSANVPRLDYTNGSCPSILVEPQRTNLLLRSEEFENSAWTKNNTNVTANEIISPNGTQNADKITPNNTNTQHFVLQNLSATSGVSYTYSVFAKKGEIDILQLSPSFSYLTTQGYANFNLTSGTVTASGGGVTASIINFGNNWYKCILTFTANATGTGGFALFTQNSPTATRGASSLGDGTSSLYLWGAQLEAGAYATSYIPTVSSAVTRNQDVISKTGISSLIGQTEGTLFFDGIVNNIQNSFSNILNTNKSTSLSTIQLAKIKSDNKFRFDQLLGNGTSSRITLNSTNAFANGTRTKIAIRYKSGSFAMYINGNLEATSSSSFTNIGTKTELFLNDAVTYFNYQESVSFNSVILFTSGLSNSELSTLTTL